MGKKRSRTEAGQGPSYLRQTLQQLDGAAWGEPDYGSYVVRTIHALRQKPLIALSDEELRLALSQQVGLPWTAELAMLRLEEDPFRSGVFHEGDVLAALLRLSPNFWVRQSALKARLETLAVAVDAAVRRFEQDEQRELSAALRAYLDR